MNTNKLINFYLIAAAILGSSVFCLLIVVSAINPHTQKQLQPPKACGTALSSTVSTTATTNETAGATDPAELKTLTYRNREFGFQFDYPSSYFVNEYRAQATTTPPDTSVIDLDKISLRNAFGEVYYGGSLTIRTIKKESAKQLFTALIDAQNRAQTQREESCKKFSGPEGFDMCAYYGGGWNYSLTTFAGAEAVRSEFRGEGEGSIRIYFPAKGVSFEYVESFPDPKIMDTFSFFDTPRPIKDTSTTISFTCPAFWTCDHNGSSYTSQADTNAAYYTLQGPQPNGIVEMYLARTSTVGIQKLIAQEKEHIDQRKHDYETDYAACVKNNTADECHAYLDNQYLTYLTEMVKIKGETVFWSEEQFKNMDGRSDVAIFSPAAGNIMIVRSSGTTLDRIFIEHLFWK